MRAIVRDSWQPRTAADDFFCKAFPGYRLESFQANSGKESLILNLAPIDIPDCPCCGNPCPKIHSTHHRTVRCAPLMGASIVKLRLPLRRVRCLQCGSTRMELVQWLCPKHKITNRLISQVQLRARSGMTNAAIAKELKLSWDTVKRFDKLQLDHAFRELDLHGVKHLIMDEFAVHKGHKYATVIMDADTHRVLWVGKGKRRADVKPFFEDITKRGLQYQIKSVAMDMNAGFPGLVRDYLPCAKVLYDGFHVLQMYTRDVLVAAKKTCQAEAIARLDAATKDDGNATVAHRKAMRALSSSQWVLVRRNDDLNRREQRKLDQLLQDNALLAALYPVADLIRALWKVKDTQAARKQLLELVALCKEIGSRFNFEPIKRFARTLKRRQEGIVEVGRFGYSSCPLEGANNKIKVLKRTAYGYRDFEYFKLKILAALPGKGASPFKGLTPGQVVTKAGVLTCCIHALS